MTCARKAINTLPLISDHFGIRRMEEVYPYIEDNPESVVKVVIDIDD